MIREFSSLSRQVPFIVLPEGYQDFEGAETIISKGNYLRDILRVVGCKPQTETWLIVNADAILASAEDAESFIQEALTHAAGIIWPLVPQPFLPAERQDWRVTKYLSGTRCQLAQGNMILAKGPMQYNKHLAELVNQFDLLGYVLGWGGFWKALKFFTGFMGTPEQAICLGRMFGCEAAFITSERWQIAFDADTPKDLEFAIRILGNRSTA